MRAIAALLALSLLLGGCSAIRTVYNQAEHLAVWRVDEYFDLSDEQKRAFRASFSRLHAWHRGSQLRNYAELLEAIDRRLQRGPGVHDIAWAYERVKAQSQPLVQQAYRDAAAFLATLSPEQIAKARRQMDDDNRKFARKHGVGAPAAEQKRRRAKDDVETIEHWAGSLDANQRARFTALSEAQPLDAALRHQERMRRQRAFLGLLNSRQDPSFPERLRQWMLDWNADRPADVEARVAEQQQARQQFLRSVYEELRPDQRRRVRERLRSYIDAMRDLSRNAHYQADRGTAQAATSLP